MQKINFTAPEPAETEQLEYPLSRAELALRAADRIGDARASILVRIVAREAGFDVCEMFHHSRSRAPIASARQLAMYMMHVVLGRNLTEVGRFFGRDRTTVSHACFRIEDMRDDPEFDERINRLEDRFEEVLAARGISSPSPWGES